MTAATAIPIPVTILNPPSASSPGRLTMIADEKRCTYEYTFFRMDGKIAGIEMRRLPDGDRHHVVLTIATGKASCDCWGAKRWGKCRHSETAADVLVLTAEKIQKGEGNG